MTMLLLGVACIGAAIALAVILVGSRPASAPADVPAAAITQTIAVSGREEDEQPSAFRLLARLGKKLTPGGYAQSLQHRLDVAGNPRGWRPERVLALKGMGLLAGVLLGLLFGAGRGALIVLTVAGLGALGFYVPDIWIRNLGEKRQSNLRDELPDAIDMMTICVEAGLGFDSALARVALNTEGPVAEEFARVLQEMQFGKSRVEALRGLVERTDVPDLRTFVSSLVQSSELGISIGDVLREQSNEMRVKRRQRAEEKAQKLPVKILAPLIICLLPAIFVVALGPAAIHIFQTFGAMSK